MPLRLSAVEAARFGSANTVKLWMTRVDWSRYDCQ